MASSIDVTKPVSGAPTTSSVRANFQAAYDEIIALQSSKADLAAPALTGSATAVNLTVSGTLNASGTLQVGGVAVTATAAELNYVVGVSSGIQAQIDLKAPLASPTFTGTVTVPDSSFTVAKTTGLQAALDAKSATGHTHATTDITSGTFADARIAASNVTQHEAAIDAGSVDGYDIVVDSGSPSGTDANTIYFVT